MLPFGQHLDEERRIALLYAEMFHSVQHDIVTQRYVSLLFAVMLTEGKHLNEEHCKSSSYVEMFHFVQHDKVVRGDR